MTLFKKRPSSARFPRHIITSRNLLFRRHTRSRFVFVNLFIFDRILKQIRPDMVEIGPTCSNYRQTIRHIALCTCLQTLMNSSLAVAEFPATDNGDFTRAAAVPAWRRLFGQYILFVGRRVETKNENWSARRLLYLVSLSGSIRMS